MAKPFCRRCSLQTSPIQRAFSSSGPCFSTGTRARGPDFPRRRGAAGRSQPRRGGAMVAQGAALGWQGEIMGSPERARSGAAPRVPMISAPFQGFVIRASLLPRASPGEAPGFTLGYLSAAPSELRSGCGVAGAVVCLNPTGFPNTAHGREALRAWAVLGDPFRVANSGCRRASSRNAAVDL